MRTTLKELEHLVNRINHVTNNNPTAWEKQNDGKYQANIGHYHIDGLYGGVSLYQIVNKGGGVRDVFGCGHMPKKDLANMMRAYLAGLSSSLD